MKNTVDSQLKTVVLVEPICRGSRLQVLANTLSALKGHVNVILVTRQDYQSAHFEELVTFVGLTPRVVTVNTDLDGIWIKNLSLREFHAFHHVLLAIGAEFPRGESYDLVFMALDDYLFAFSIFGLWLKLKMRNARMTCLKYRVEYLFALSEGRKPRGIALRLLTRWSLFSAAAQLICFDERLFALRPRYLAGLLPDPWFGNFGPQHRAEGRALLDVQASDFVMLTLGKQDRRKGIDFLINAFPILAADCDVKLAVVGTVSDAFAGEFARLKESFPAQIVHVDAYVPESDLPKFFSAADAFLLPYSKDFTATSGTLARAAASGVAVLSACHGLVGYRVAEYGLGETFTIGDIAEFSAAVGRIRGYSALRQALVRSSLLNFAESASLSEFHKKIREVFL